MKYVLVTGGTGFIGRYVVEELRNRGYIPVILDREQRTQNYSNIVQPVVFGDIKDATLVTEAVAHVDGVIHLAGVLGTQETIANPLPAAETNILGGLNVLQACAQYDVPLVNIAVGNYWMSNTYSITKNTIERFCEMYTKFRGSQMTVVRALNAYGPRQVPVPPWGSSRVRKIMPSFICRALSGEPIEIYGDGTQIMDMIYVEDVAEILVRALELTNDDGAQPTIEAGTGRDTTVNMIAEEVVRNVPDATIKYLPMRPGEEEQSVVKADPDKILDLGHMLTPLEDGVRVTVDYFRDEVIVK
jgi:nucleoside-diphosphate-sugar epimerase